jgi:2-oxoglutarate dehydrogenase E2 component (dihydrolipoamide succinyltransferase)
VLTKIVVGEDETVEVGAELAVIGGGSGGGDGQQAAQPAEQQEQPAQQARSSSLISAPASQQAPDQQAAPAQQVAPAQQAAPAQQSAPAQQAAPAQQSAPAQPAATGDGGSTYVTPLVRKLASEHGVDLSTLRGTGVGGRIRKQDVLEAAAAKQPQPAAASEAPAATGGQAPAASPLRGTTEKMSRLRKVIAARMVESLQVSAQLTTVVEVDLTRIARLRARAKADFEAREGVKLSFLPFLAKATVEALKAHPMVNASIDTEKGEITYHGAEHLGVAVDTERGLLVPVVKDAGDLNIAGLARKIADLAERTRNNKITPDELGGGTFTLTNTGSRGALFDTPIINQPQVGILGTGAVVKRPVVVDDPDLGETIAIRSMCYLALSYDHRLVDGADAARFLATIKARLEEGSYESDLGL